MPVSKYEALKADWKDNLAGSQKLTASSAYVHQDGKPVVGLWGLGFTHIAGTAAECIELINWFKDQGCYVIGGGPYDGIGGVEYRMSFFISPFTKH